MADILDRVGVVNRALARIGASAIVSLDDEGDLERAATLIYEVEIRAALGRHPWRFASRTTQLTALAGQPASGWLFAYQAPGGALAQPYKLLTDPRRADRPLRRFEIEWGEIHSDEPKLWARAVYMAEPELWPPDFTLAIVTALAAELAVPTAHDLALAAALRRTAYGEPAERGTGGLMGQAIAREIATAPPQAGSADDDPLTGVRWS